MGGALAIVRKAAIVILLLSICAGCSGGLSPVVDDGVARIAHDPGAAPPSGGAHDPTGSRPSGPAITTPDEIDRTDDAAAPNDPAVGPAAAVPGPAAGGGPVIIPGGPALDPGLAGGVGRGNPFAGVPADGPLVIHVGPALDPGLAGGIGRNNPFDGLPVDAPDDGGAEGEDDGDGTDPGEGEVEPGETAVPVSRSDPFTISDPACEGRSPQIVSGNHRFVVFLEECGSGSSLRRKIRFSAPFEEEPFSLDLEDLSERLYNSVGSVRVTLLNRADTRRNAVEFVVAWEEKRNISDYTELRYQIYRVEIQPGTGGFLVNGNLAAASGGKLFAHSSQSWDPLKISDVASNHLGHFAIAWTHDYDDIESLRLATVYRSQFSIWTSPREIEILVPEAVMYRGRAVASRDLKDVRVAINDDNRGTVVYRSADDDARGGFISAHSGFRIFAFGQSSLRCLDSSWVTNVYSGASYEVCRADSDELLLLPYVLEEMNEARFGNIRLGVAVRPDGKFVIFKLDKDRWGSWELVGDVIDPAFTESERDLRDNPGMRLWSAALGADIDLSTFAVTSSGDWAGFLIDTEPGEREAAYRAFRAYISGNSLATVVHLNDGILLQEPGAGSPRVAISPEGNLDLTYSSKPNNNQPARVLTKSWRQR